ncbi:MAG: hypothetical protein IPK75_18365 [Acidobacteria bacterium]|nr:hypothetical protein [Acidobacteriota bacterium]
MSISGAVNGTDERLDVLIALFEQLLAELRQANALQGATPLDVTTHSSGELKPAKGARRTSGKLI